jgi:YesN/AraC family two-component response regulator
MFKLLIVDDEPSAGKTIRYVLKKVKKPKIEVVGIAYNGKEAIEETIRLKPDIILMDIEMPVLDGISASGRIRKLNSAIKIIFLTAHAEFDYAQQAVKLKASDYILKPLTPQKIKSTLNKVTKEIQIERAKIYREEKLRQELRKVMPFIKTLSEDERTRNEIIIAKARKFIEENYNTPLTLKNLAGAVSLSPAYFSSFFKRESGLSFSEYLNKVRIEKAKELLKDPKFNITKVAFEIGYDDSQYFCRIFKKFEGISPRQYQKTNY